MTDPSQTYSTAALQALLFASARPVSTAEAAQALQIPAAEAEAMLEQLVAEFNPGGLQVVRVGGGYQMTTHPELAGLVARFLQPRPQRLSQPALETLALIAYRQPVTQPEIEAVRGVKSDSSVRTLLERGLIQDAGRKEVVGRPILYRTTPELLVYLGISSLEDLPEIPLETPSGTPSGTPTESPTEPPKESPKESPAPLVDKALEPSG
jgi:segregation and condensation protein B